MSVRGEVSEAPVKARPILRRGAWALFALICALAISHAQTIIHKPGKVKPSSSALATGQQTFETNCASCHGLNGMGGERAPDIATKPEIVTLSDAETLKLLRDGIPAKEMPPFARLGAARLSELVDYLRILQGNRKATVPHVGSNMGRELFAGKGGCTQCHMVHGTGGFLGPNLSDYGASHSAGDIRDAIVSVDKRPAIHKGLATATTLDGKQISGLPKNEDNFSVQLQALDGTFLLLRKSDLAKLEFDSSPLMPDDYGSKLSKSELDELVSYLLSVVEKPRDRQATEEREFHDEQ
jgi:cytochrome c oxidase cbb3-type subunit III